MFLHITNAPIDDTGLEAFGIDLLDVIANAARLANCNVLMTHIEAFDGKTSPPGFASVCLLNESHITAHCYSDMGLMAVDIFTCGSDPSATERVAEHIAAHIKSILPQCGFQAA